MTLSLLKAAFGDTNPFNAGFCCYILDKAGCDYFKLPFFCIGWCGFLRTVSCSFDYWLTVRFATLAFDGEVRLTMLLGSSLWMGRGCVRAILLLASGSALVSISRAGFFDCIFLVRTVSFFSLPPCIAAKNNNIDFINNRISKYKKIVTVNRYTSLR